MNNLLSENYMQTGSSPEKFVSIVNERDKRTYLHLCSLNEFNVLVYENEKTIDNEIILFFSVFEPETMWANSDLKKNKLIKVPKNLLIDLYGPEEIEELKVHKIALIQKNAESLKGIFFIGERARRDLELKFCTIKPSLDVETMPKVVILAEALKSDEEVALICRVGNDTRAKKIIAIRGKSFDGNTAEMLWVHHSLQNLVHGYVPNNKEMEYVLTQNTLYYRVYLLAYGRTLRSKYGLEKDYIPVIEIKTSDMGTSSLICNVSICEKELGIFVNLPQLKKSVSHKNIYSKSDVDRICRDAIENIAQVEVFYQKMADKKKKVYKDPFKERLSKLLIDCGVDKDLSTKRVSSFLNEAENKKHYSEHDLYSSVLSVSSLVKEYSDNDIRTEHIKDGLGQWILAPST